MTAYFSGDGVALPLPLGLLVAALRARQTVVPP